MRIESELELLRALEKTVRELALSGPDAEKKFAERADKILCELKTVRKMKEREKKMPKNGHVKFKNETEALAWASFAAGVASDLDEEEAEEVLEETAKIADKMLVENFRKRMGDAPER